MDEQLLLKLIPCTEEKTEFISKHSKIVADQLENDKTSTAELSKLRELCRYALFAPAANRICELLERYDTSTFTPEQVKEFQGAAELYPYCKAKTSICGQEARCYFEDFEFNVFEDEGPILLIYPNKVIKAKYDKDSRRKICNYLEPIRTVSEKHADRIKELQRIYFPN